MPYLDLSPDTRLFYEIDTWADAWTEPETVLMIHGFTETTEAWRAWVPQLGRKYRVLRFDQLGFGRSSSVTRDFKFSTELFVDNAVRVIDRIALGAVHVIGAKSGGLIAAELARLRPDLVRTVTLASTPLAPPQPQGWLEHMDAHGMRSWARMTMPQRLGPSMPPRGIDWWVDMMGATSLDTAHVYLRWVSSINVGPDLGGVKCPALVLTTKTPRRSYSRSDLEVFQEKLPHAEIVAIDSDGYHVAGTAADLCAPIVLDFLARNGGSHA
ncbi:MAG: alpha/beta hydrolase [Betaproteobacteria bacterium]|nr:alpha/beta hydrolase [Betaproteobacteria bacterium]